MKVNSYKTQGKFSISTVGLLLLLLAICPHRAVAQTKTNTFPDDGNAGVGTTTPSSLLEVNKSQNSGTTIIVDNGYTTSGNAAYSGLFFKQGGSNRFLIGSINDSNVSAFGGSGAVQIWNFTNGPMLFATNNTERLRIDASGNVGIGTSSPTAKLHVYGSGNIQSIVQSTTAAAELDLISSATNYGSWGMGTGWSSVGVRSFYLYDFVASAPRLLIDASGNVGIGTTTPANKLHVAGSITVDGNINAKYQDVAEWVPASHALPAGTVVTLDPTKSNHVEASSQAYDTRVAGVVSEQPGITLGESGESKVLVATTGRVQVTVDASHAPIHIGDLLVTSDIAGVAMKSEPITIGGRQIHSPGTLIGKALEPLEKGSAKILVLLSLQ